jgi:hypothetical protein
MAVRHIWTPQCMYQLRMFGPIKPHPKELVDAWTPRRPFIRSIVEIYTGWWLALVQLMAAAAVHVVGPREAEETQRGH